MTSRWAAALLLAAAAPLVDAGEAARVIAGAASRAIAGDAGPSRIPLPTRATVEVIGPDGTDTIADATPEFTVLAHDFGAADQPITLRFVISTRGDFAPPLFLDTTVVGESASIRPPRPLPEGERIWWEASATSALGETVTSELYGPRTVAPWLALVSPNDPNGTLVQTRRPRFTWTGLPITEPPGPWIYDLDVISVGSQRIALALRSWPDTTFLPTTDLESNTSYRWEVVARLATGESTVARSVSTFVVLDASTPLTTLLYQNFPNPFPTPTSAATCIWFDLHEAGPVRLEIYDLRGHLVRRLVDGAPLEAGRYGRGGSGTSAACDPAFAWNGTADDGRTVPAGVYLVRLRAAGVHAVRRALFRGTSQ